MTLYKDKYRVESARLKDWDYSHPGFYFVTVCTYQREHCLGVVTDNTAEHSTAGEIVWDEWMKTETIRPNVRIDALVVMPNHVHAIVVITHRVDEAMEETLQRNVSTIPNPSRLKRNSLGAIVGQIKIQCTKRIRVAGMPEFDWQERFWDEILWDEKAIANVRQYIENNPVNWERDREKPSGLWM
jgi:putative transposase